MSGLSAVKGVIRNFRGQNALARALGVRQSVVWGWTKSEMIPSRRIPEIIAAAARLDPPVILRPDDFFDLPAADSGLQNRGPAEPAPAAP